MRGVDLNTRIWRIGLVLVAVAFGMAIGAFVSGGLSSANEAGAAVPVGPDVGDIRVAPNPAGPTDKIEGVGVGFIHTEDGAVAAATNLVLTLEQAAASDRASAIRAYEILASEASRTTLTDEMGQVWDTLNQSIAVNGPPASSLYLRTIPIGHGLTRYSDDRATVTIWTMTLVAADGMQEPLAGFETATVELVWEAEDWKIWSATSASGPVPGWAEQPTGIDVFLDGVEELEGYRYVSN